MPVVTTRSGKSVEIISKDDLRSPQDTGTYMRAYCHMHGSDHQRSLSINKATGWGRCFHAACTHRLVLVAEWNPQAAAHLLHVPDSTTPPSSAPRRLAEGQSSYPGGRRLVQKVLLPEPRNIPQWQQDEFQTLIKLEPRMQNALARTAMAQAYLRERGIPLEVAQLTGVGYLPPDLPASLETPERHWTLRRWAGRVSFPLYTPFERGFIGRTVRHWRPGMDEHLHKRVLERPGRPRRWTKTNPAGWFCCPFEKIGKRLIVVEGPFDRLSLLAAGFEPEEVVALAGTSVQADWFPAQVQSIVLALDGDEGGREASQRIAEQLVELGIAVQRCGPPQDGQGKDWNERWRRLGWEGIEPLWDSYASGG
jgi:hypothetical protein